MYHQKTSNIVILNIQDLTQISITVNTARLGTV